MEHSTILEDDQQLYDWGIERLDQYYLNGENSGHPHGHPHGNHHQYPYNNSNVNSNYEGYNGNPGELQSHHPHHRTFMASHHGEHQAQRPGCSSSSNSSISPSSPKDGGDLIRSLSNHLSNSNRNNILNNKRQFLPQAVDMDINESLKVERKRARNRVAASKCRLRKLERISILDQQASQLRADNDELASLSTKLKAEIFALKEELNWHINNGCKIWYSEPGYMERKSSHSTDSASSSPLPHFGCSNNVKEETPMYSPGQELSS